MNTTSTEAGEPLPPEYEVALNYTPAPVRDAACCYLSLDRRLARIVGQTSEPMLGQMRLAWWRDTLSAPVADRPKGDIVLEGAATQWAGHEKALIALVDAWEEMLVEPPLPRDAAMCFAEGRAAGFLELAEIAALQLDMKRYAYVGQAWALADAASHVPESEERALLLDCARSIPSMPHYPKIMRGAAVLDALAHRAIAKGGRPLMDGRGAALTALKIGLIG